MTDLAPKRGNLKRVAGNTLFMYSRTVFSLALNLFATRLVLKTLGVEDFGLFAVLASIIASFSFITGAVNASVSRFLCAALGHEDRREFSAVFTASAVLLFGVALLIAALTELCGLWYIQNHLVVAPERLPAAMTAFHFCVASTVILIIALPYQAALISQENIRAFALFTGVARKAVYFNRWI
jgi:Na+-driven multidrug efflux pump